MNLINYMLKYIYKHLKESEIMIIELEDNKHTLNSLKQKITEIGESL